jgi:hypothetical protein
MDGVGADVQLKEIKSLLHDKCIEMIKEIQNKETKLVQWYKNNPTTLFDFYFLTMRELDTRLVAVRELYKRLTDEEL